MFGFANLGKPIDAEAQVVQLSFGLAKSPSRPQCAATNQGMKDQKMKIRREVYFAQQPPAPPQKIPPPPLSSTLSTVNHFNFIHFHHDAADPLLPALDHDALEVLDGKGNVLHSVTVGHQVGTHLLSTKIIISKEKFSNLVDLRVWLVSRFEHKDGVSGPGRTNARAPKCECLPLLGLM